MRRHVILTLNQIIVVAILSFSKHGISGAMSTKAVVYMLLLLLLTFVLQRFFGASAHIKRDFLFAVVSISIVYEVSLLIEHSLGYLPRYYDVERVSLLPLLLGLITLYLGLIVAFNKMLDWFKKRKGR
jgi:hypothetical protein